MGSEQLKKALENIGYSVSGIKSAEKEFAGAKLSVIMLECKCSDKKGYGTVISKKVGKYMVSVTVLKVRKTLRIFLAPAAE